MSAGEQAIEALLNMGATVKMFVGVRLDPATVTEVDEVADDEVSSRSEVIRRYVDEGLRRDRRKRERMSG